MIRGEEAVLKQLDSLWPQVQLQTKWELNPLFSYSTDGTDVNSDLGDPSSTSPKPADATAILISQEDTNPGDKSSAATSSSSFCQTQTLIPVT